VYKVITISIAAASFLLFVRSTWRAFTRYENRAEHLSKRDRELAQQAKRIFDNLPPCFEHAEAHESKYADLHEAKIREGTLAGIFLFFGICALLVFQHL
jgi:hypothetical protein